MARVSMVTRTVFTQEVEVLCMNVETATVETKTVEVVGNVSDNTAILKAVKSKIETDTLKAVHITKITEKETLYGMTEEDFIKLAKTLPPRSAKETASETTIETAETDK
jgi:hypothetical protein